MKFLVQFTIKYANFCIFLRRPKQKILPKLKFQQIPKVGGQGFYILSLSVESGWRGFNRTSVVISKKIRLLRKNSGIFM